MRTTTMEWYFTCFLQSMRILSWVATRLRWSDFCRPGGFCSLGKLPTGADHTIPPFQWDQNNVFHTPRCSEYRTCTYEVIGMHIMSIGNELQKKKEKKKKKTKRPSFCEIICFGHWCKCALHLTSYTSHGHSDS
mmetsp:Transcript_122732/g.212848  ORF Transcript_122732/g.212848 Transcript_122732/m.212848 type:complete len:134 (-) Transcript_122732:26-427(-)